MSIFVLKIIAILTMTIDHLGMVIFDNNIVMRSIGRLSFPIFAWLIANGYRYTKDVRKYVIRLLIAGVLSEPLYDYFLKNQWFNMEKQNIFFTLAMGLTCIWILDYFKKIENKSGIFVVIILGLLADVLSFDYGLYGVILILIFHYYKDNFWKVTLGVIGINLYVWITYYMQYQTLSTGVMIQSFSVLSLAFIYRYNGQLGPRLKYLFYLFYPLHLLIIKCLSLMG